MNNKLYRKIRKNTKALSPVVASIILIAVTVAVSVVVAAWMGGTTIGLMGSAEKVAVTNLSFDPTNNQIIATIQNTGTVQSTLSTVYVTGGTAASATIQPGNGTIPVGTSANTVIINVLPAGSLESGLEYTIKFTTAKANSITYAQVMP
jgi:flagellin-like protein